MPYILTPLIKHQSPGMWGEGIAYEKKEIFSIEAGKLPPVNYDQLLLKSHSLTHMEFPAHTNTDGARLEDFFPSKVNLFFGETLVLKLKGNHFEQMGKGIFHWKISKDQIERRIEELGIINLPPKILISTDDHPLNTEGYHDPNYVLTLTQEAANFLVSAENFHLYGTSWKSSDYNPGKPDRPIHNTLFKKAVILENLALKSVPEGLYFMCACPLPLEGVSESPVVPVLFDKNEINNIF